MMRQREATPAVSVEILSPSTGTLVTEARPRCPLLRRVCSVGEATALLSLLFALFHEIGAALGHLLL